MVQIILKRIYEPYDQMDGCRILVDRLWPRGISKEKAKLTVWAKELAPSHELRKWFGHRTTLYEEFRIKYLKELKTDPIMSKCFEEIYQIALTRKITLLYAAKDSLHNNAHILKEALLKRDDNISK
ncbi:DUF488 family protein [Cytobacillus solani]|uniref:DUF488 domain-containing protein n=1 Tax=Cytobacillus solani TaxID=1637975 RepID=UPI0020795EAA|nr:DUF488 family protein [Cytobacillus solani]USK54187.1 DUF488 family protein [Cytobacillus solani]